MLHAGYSNRYSGGRKDRREREGALFVGWQEEASSTGDHGAGKEIQVGTTPTGWIKFNVDSSFVQQSGKAGVGVVARDSKGDVLLMASPFQLSGCCRSRSSGLFRRISVGCTMDS
jgi:hypothetical protein